LLFFAVPLPDAVVCDFIVQPVAGKTVYVQHDATLGEIHVASRQHVEKGDKIATLRNLDVELEISDLQGKLAELENQQRMLRLSRYESTEGSEQLRNLRQERITIEQRLAELNKIQSEMVFVAPQSGTVIAQWQHRTPQIDPDQLQTWDGWALHVENVSSQLQRGQPICKIGDLSRPEAKLVIDQGDIQFVSIGQRVQLMLDSGSGPLIESKIASIAESDAEQITTQVAQQFGGTIETRTDKQSLSEEIADPGSARPASAIYEASVPLPPSQPLEDGLRGIARIEIGQRTLASRLYRFLQKTFRIDL